jgi:hypothetical protein
MWKSRLLLSLLLTAAVYVHASTVIPIDVAAQVDEADLIFIGTVVGMENVPVKDGTFAFTYVTFHIEETLKGSASAAPLTRRVAGGKARGHVFSIGGGPQFETGGRHLLFVLGNDRYAIPFSGGSQGKLNFMRDPVTQEEILVDEAGRAIDGLRGGNWRYSAVRLDRGGQLQRPERVAELVSQSGVTVVLEQPDADVQTIPASRVIAGLRALIQSRAFAPEFRRTAVRSASPANVPATDPDRAPVRAQ